MSIETNIKNYIEKNGVDTGKARRVNYMEMLSSDYVGSYAAEVAGAVESLEKRRKAVYISGLRKLFGQKVRDVGEEPQAGCLYLF